MFNRITFRYHAAAPMTGVVLYEVDGQTVQDVFFLEAAQDGTFQLLIRDALAGKLAENCRMSSLTAPRGYSHDAELYEITTDTADLTGEPILERGGVRLGITLEMGGAIAALYDDGAPAGYTNLLNRCDTGRLIQQSYYGCRTEPYELGEFMGNPWPYNPVQGGDKGGYRSRIISYTRSDDEIYIKAQPYDWGHVGSITPSYMENRYRFLEDGLILVENRFTDFSGLNHPVSHQELPAFYVVSALDTFTWEDAGIRCSRDDMIFWPLAKDQNFHLQEPDSAFCVWHEQSGYGVGLAVPGVEQYYAGRHEYNGSKDPHDAGTNYVAPLQSIRLQSYVPLSYRYLLAVGDLETIAGKFRRILPQMDNRSLQEYGR
ncbi:MAG: hypothetical protein IKY52_12550 [Clostridia bacterium]|nr:hypothetical protein [Clostridia bacterium]